MLNNIPIKISVMIMATCCSANCSEVAFKRLTENKAFHRAKATVMKCSVHASSLEISRLRVKVLLQHLRRDVLVGAVLQDLLDGTDLEDPLHLRKALLESVNVFKLLANQMTYKINQMT